MTYEELLEKLDYHRCVYTPALRAVIELHKPEPTSNGEPGCPECVKLIRVDGRAMTYRYPCPTIQAIEKELV